MSAKKKARITRVHIGVDELAVTRQIHEAVLEETLRRLPSHGEETPRLNEERGCLYEHLFAQTYETLNTYLKQDRERAVYLTFNPDAVLHNV